MSCLKVPKHIAAVQFGFVPGYFTGSIAYIFQPIGSIVSGWFTDPLGRKKSMFIVNFPHVIAWFLMYKATEVWHIFVANVLLGLGVGLMEAPILTYVGEIRYFFSKLSKRGCALLCQ